MLAAQGLSVNMNAETPLSPVLEDEQEEEFLTASAVYNPIEGASDDVVSRSSSKYPNSHPIPISVEAAAARDDCEVIDLKSEIHSDASEVLPLVTASRRGFGSQRYVGSRKKSKWGRRIWISLGLVVGGCVISAGVFRLTQEKMLLDNETNRCPDIAIGYESNGNGWRSPAEYGVFKWHPVNFRNRRGDVLKGFFLRHKDGPAHPTVVLFQGRSGNAGKYLPLMVTLYKKLGVNVLCADYAGFGASEGEATEAHIYEDAEDIVNHLLTRHAGEIDPKRLFAWGHSLGAAVAAHVLSTPKTRRKMTGLILQSPVANAWTGVCPSGFWHTELLRGIVKTIGHCQYDTSTLIQNVSKPTLILQGDRDNQTPMSEAEELWNRCGSTQKDLGVIRGGTHGWSSYVIFPDVLAAVDDFLQRASRADFDSTWSKRWEAGAQPLLGEECKDHTSTEINHTPLEQDQSPSEVKTSAVATEIQAQQ